MKSKILNPRQSLNKAYLKLKPNRSDVEKFKTNLKRLLSKIDEIESEENQKNHVRDFLRDSYYLEKYPSVKKHLDQFLPQLKKRADKGETPYNLRNCAYLNDFEKPKIIYPEMTKFLNFTLDVDDNFYTNNKNFIFTGERLYWLTSFFNSQLWRYCFRDNFPELLGGTRELRKVFFEKIPVKQITEKQELPFKKLVTKIIEAKKKDPAADTGKWEKEIDEMLYKLYGLTEEEIGIVEGGK